MSQAFDSVRIDGTPQNYMLVKTVVVSLHAILFTITIPAAIVWIISRDLTRVFKKGIAVFVTAENRCQKTIDLGFSNFLHCAPFRLTCMYGSPRDKNRDPKLMRDYL